MYSLSETMFLLAILGSKSFARICRGRERDSQVTWRGEGGGSRGRQGAGGERVSSTINCRSKSQRKRKKKVEDMGNPTYHSTDPLHPSCQSSNRHQNCSKPSFAKDTTTTTTRPIHNLAHPPSHDATPPNPHVIPPPSIPYRDCLLTSRSVFTPH